MTELENMRDTLTRCQAEGTRLVEENRQLSAELEVHATKCAETIQEESELNGRRRVVWLIERLVDGVVRWWSRAEWTNDAYLAAWFVRAQDAFEVAECFLPEGSRPTEHVFMEKEAELHLPENQRILEIRRLEAEAVSTERLYEELRAEMKKELAALNDHLVAQTMKSADYKPSYADCRLHIQRIAVLEKAHFKWIETCTRLTLQWNEYSVMVGKANERIADLEHECKAKAETIDERLHEVAQLRNQVVSLESHHAADLHKWSSAHTVLEQQFRSVQERIAIAIGYLPHKSGRWHSRACQRDQENCGGKLPTIEQLTWILETELQELRLSNDRALAAQRDYEDANTKLETQIETVEMNARHAEKVADMVIDQRNATIGKLEADIKGLKETILNYADDAVQFQKQLAEVESENHELRMACEARADERDDEAALLAKVIHFDDEFKVWVGRVGSVISQGTTREEAIESVSSAVDLTIQALSEQLAEERKEMEAVNASYQAQLKNVWDGKAESDVKLKVAMEALSDIADSIDSIGSDITTVSGSLIVEMGIRRGQIARDAMAKLQ